MNICGAIVFRQKRKSNFGRYYLIYTYKIFSSDNIIEGKIKFWKFLHLCSLLLVQFVFYSSLFSASPCTSHSYVRNHVLSSSFPCLEMVYVYDSTNRRSAIKFFKFLFLVMKWNSFHSNLEFYVLPEISRIKNKKFRLQWSPKEGICFWNKQ